MNGPLYDEDWDERTGSLIAHAATRAELESMDEKTQNLYLQGNPVLLIGRAWFVPEEEDFHKRRGTLLARAGAQRVVIKRRDDLGGQIVASVYEGDQLQYSIASSMEVAECIKAADEWMQERLGFRIRVEYQPPDLIPAVKINDDADNPRVENILFPPGLLESMGMEAIDIDELERRSYIKQGVAEKLHGPGYPIVRYQSCSWCHHENNSLVEYCAECGHCAQIPRMQCYCDQCYAPRPQMTEADVNALDDFLEGKHAAEENDSGV